MLVLGEKEGEVCGGKRVSYASLVGGKVVTNDSTKVSDQGNEAVGRNFLSSTEDLEWASRGLNIKIRNGNYVSMLQHIFTDAGF